MGIDRLKETSEIDYPDATVSVILKMLLANKVNH